MVRWRPPQQEILDYTSGRMGVSAVPGSGKTQTLSGLAARLIVEGRLDDDQEVLVVTLVNSAVENFSSRIEKFLAPYQLVPGMGYRVRTLHGLAHDIVRERPDLVGLSSRFQIIDEPESDSIISDAARAWLRANPDVFSRYVKDDVDPVKIQRIATHDWPLLITSLARSYISQAKDLQATPEIILKKHSLFQTHPILLQIGCDIYEDYQRALIYRNAVDFHDLIRLALLSLKTDPEYLARLRRRWPYILEDEAQDSSRLQEEILSFLSGDNGNWVRVGDPNQAIYETFTTASPKFLIDFRKRPDVQAKDLPHSGRSTRSIINLANFLNEWVQKEFTIDALRNALTTPFIQSTPLDDPQPNPPDNSRGIYMLRQKCTPDEEVRKVVQSLLKWLPEHPSHTAAILVPRNERGTEVVAALRKEGIEPVELLRSSQSTRDTAAILSAVLNHLADPTNNHKLANLFKLILSSGEDQQTQKEISAQIEKIVRSIRFNEDFLWPRPGQNWLDALRLDGDGDEIITILESIRSLLQRWQKAALLPVDQLILIISQDLFDEPADLALAHKLALVLEQESQRHADWSFPEYVLELDQIARNERKFLGFSDQDANFDPDQYKGKVVVSTIHKAKGLEWDRVHLLSVNNYDFPLPDNADSWISEKWFIRDHLNLEAETIDLLKSLLNEDVVGLNLAEGEASQQARIDYAAERLRLLYVGITRARRELIISWNTGKRGTCIPSTSFLALMDFWESQTDALTD